MKNTTTALKISWHAFERDMRHDWQDWSPAERIAVKAMGISSAVVGAFYLGLSLI